MLAIRRWKRKFQAADELKYRLRSTMCQAPARHAHCPVVTSIFRAVTGPQPSSSTPTESSSAKIAPTASAFPRSQGSPNLVLKPLPAFHIVPSDCPHHARVLESSKANEAQGQTAKSQKSAPGRSRESETSPRPTDLRTVSLRQQSCDTICLQ